MTRTPVSESLAAQLAAPTLVLDASCRLVFVHSNQAREFVRDDRDDPVMFPTIGAGHNAYLAAMDAVSAVLNIGAGA